MPDINCLVEVRGVRQGSGYLIAPSLVLTAWHLIRPDPANVSLAAIAVRVEGEIGEDTELSSADRRARVIWPDHEPGSDFDFALLRIETSSTVAVPVVHWSPLEGIGRMDVQALGYPNLAMNQTHKTRDTKDVQGWTNLGDSWRQRKKGIGAFEIRLQSEDLPEESAANAWPAMSGAAVFGGSALLGVVRSAREINGHHILRATPVERLFERSDVIDAIRRAGCDLPLRIPLSAVRGREMGQHRPHVALRIDRLPTVKGVFVGRKAELRLLDKAWLEKRTRIVQFIAPGGTGKTKLLRHWIDNRNDITELFAWSFYLQGSSEDKQATASLFFSYALKALGSRTRKFPTEEAKGEHVAEMLRRRKCLLVLDGLEPLQHSTRGMQGDLRKR